MTPAILVSNVGSGTVALHLYRLADIVSHRFDRVEPWWRADLIHHERPIVIESSWTSGSASTVEAPDAGIGDAVALAASALDDPRVDVVASGHRIVHGGLLGDRPRLLDDALVDAIRRAGEALAPVHTDLALDVVQHLRQRWDTTPHIALFDTEFHATIPSRRRTTALPDRWRSPALDRFGFHGISHREVSIRAALLLDRPIEDCNLITVHLGGGCSAAAIRGGRSVATTMGTTPNSGMVMAARSGSVDPGLLLHLQTRDQVGPDEMRRVLEAESGLVGLSGGDTGDIGRLGVLASDGDPAAQLAVDVYVEAAQREIASLRPALDALDAVAFTGSAAVANPWLIEGICAPLGPIGIATAAWPDGAPHHVLEPKEEPAMAAAVASLLA